MSMGFVDIKLYTVPRREKISKGKFVGGEWRVESGEWSECGMLVFRASRDWGIRSTAFPFSLAKANSQFVTA